MIRAIRHTRWFCLLLLAALVASAVRVQLVEAGKLDASPGNRRSAVARYGQPRGDIVVGGRAVTGSTDTGEQLRFERSYADGPLYAPVTGFSSQEYGTSLLESAEDRVLSGADPGLAPLPLYAAVTGSRSPGGRVVTTLNAAAQRAGFRGLGGRRGAVAAVEPATGRVLALVSTPSYDPGLLSGNGAAVERAWRRLNASPDAPMLNRAIHQTYPPGSTFKVVTAAAALDSGAVADVDAPSGVPDPYRLPGSGRRLGNEVAGCADASLRYAFVWSCNTVFAGTGVRTGLAAMARTAGAFGFNDTRLRIPAPVAASTFDTRMDDAQLALSSIGQFDTRATPLQMAMVAAAVADGGTVRTPYLVDRTTTVGGRAVRAAGPPLPRRAMAPATAALLRRLMVEAVAGGTARRAAIRGAEVGGKTGTAQHGVGNAGTPYAWFVSWARPEGGARAAVAVAVVVEDAEARRSEISGGGSAGPIARAVMRACLPGGARTPRG